MKIIYKTAAQGLLFLAACLPAAGQVNVTANHASDGSSVQTSASIQEAQVKTLQQQLESYEQKLRAKAEQVDSARQEAISAGIQGDGAGPFIDAYREEQKELDALQAALATQIERTRALLASLANPVSAADASVSKGPAAAQRAISNSQGRKPTRNQTIARRDSSKLNPVAK